MNVAELKLDRKAARELYQKYKAHQHYSAPIDHEIRRAYQLIAQGRMVIQALESIRRAGTFDTGLPKLAITRADAERIDCRVWSNGSAKMEPSDNRWGRTTRSGVFNFPAGTFDPRSRDAWKTAEAIVPTCPVHLRPKRGLANYFTMWEAEWSKIIPKDPMLLRRIGKGDMWLVVAAWDLTEVERAALSTRLNA